MPNKLAITISGAVSLGSYEAGVLYEVIRAIGQHNQHPDTIACGQQIYIDVLTGASAGGMTAAIAAQKLLYDSDSLADPYNNAFYQPWVAEIGIDSLLNFHGNDDPSMSIFSSQAVVDISEKMLTDRYTSHMSPPSKPHPALDRQNLDLGLALANLNGVDYKINTRPSGSLIYTRHKDELIRRFPAAQRTDDDNGDLWEALRDAAVSCGAFPFAFRVVELVRHATEYTLPDQANIMPQIQNFAYTDGGTFQNEPISLAKRLVDEIDNHLHQEQRFFLFVAPDLKASAANSEFNEDNAHFLPTAKRLVGAIFNQARFPDLLLAEGKNCEVGLLNQRAQALGTMLNAGDASVANLAITLQAAATPLLNAMFMDNQGATDQDAINVARTRLSQQFGGDFPGMNQATRNAWIDSILTLERAAALGETDEMTIYSVIANDSELASTDLVAFAGFLDRRCRDHDYDIGRQKAQEFLNTPGIFGFDPANPAQNNGKLRYAPLSIRTIDTSLDGLKLSAMDRNIREKVRDQMLNRANEMLMELGIQGFLWGPAVRGIVDCFVKPKLNKLLEL
jgi:predicted acylesterase/phospholipase RssA